MSSVQSHVLSHQRDPIICGGETALGDSSTRDSQACMSGGRDASNNCSVPAISEEHSNCRMTPEVGTQTNAVTSTEMSSQGVYNDELLLARVPADAAPSQDVSGSETLLLEAGGGDHHGANDEGWKEDWLDVLD